MADEDEEIDFSLMDDDSSTEEGNNPGIADAASVDIESFMDDMGFVQEGADIDLSKPWMKLHKFELVKRAGRLREVIDECLAAGRCALDLETQGFDNRIEYDEEGKPYTRHQIVGYCLGVEGRGYYIPVRHKEDPVYRSDSPNVDDIKAAEAEITRLCQAAQPILTEEAKQTDPLSGKAFVEGGEPKVVIEFWHSKFDQEFLFPITGIDWWHPDSFEDGMLANYVRYTDDDHGLKENALTKIPPVEIDGEKHYYEMIKFDQLFPSGMKAVARKFQDLFPEEDGNGWNAVLYGCSDGICTNLLCGRLVPYIMSNHLLANTYRLEKQVVQAVRILERQRILINKEAIMELLQEAEFEFEEYEKKIVALAAAKGFHNFNPGSSGQLADFLFTENGLDLKPKPAQTAEGQYKTDEKTIDSYVENNPNAPEVLLWIVKYRQISKVKGTYLVNLANNTDELNQLRLNFKQTGAATGRFTAPKGEADHGFAGVPIQGIPARDDPKKPKVAHSMRRLFIARPGYKLIKVDYASQELRIASNVSGERKWIAEYEKEAQTGEPADLHFLTAMAFFPGLTKDSPDFKLKRGMGKCVHPDTIVDAERGYRLLRDAFLFPEKEDTFLEVEGTPSSLSQLDGNSVVATYNGGIKPLVHVVTRKGIVTCTHEHRFKMEHGELVRAGSLKKGDVLVAQDLPTMPRVGGSPILDIKLWKGVPSSKYRANIEEAYFAGVFLGDGSVSASGCRLIHGDVEKLDAFEESYEKWQDSLVETCAQIGLDPTREDKSLYLGSRVVVKYLQGLGLVIRRPNTKNGRLKNLRVPQWVIAGGQEKFLPFLGGLIDTDGSVSHQQKTIEFTTKDFVFAGQIAALAQACGLDLSVEATYNKTYQRHYARLRFTVESSWKLRHYLRYPGKIARLGEPTGKSMMPDVNDVLVILPAGEGPCLDVTMGTEEHLYRANGLLTHNTANFALVYGGGVGAVQRATGCDKHEGARLKKAFDDSVPQFSTWVKKQHKLVKEKKGVYTAFRRFIAIPDANITPEQVQKRALQQKSPRELSKSEAWKEAKRIQAACERKSTNFPIQGSGADILKISLVMLVKELVLRGWLREYGGDDSVRLVMTVHDEIVFEVKEDRIAESLPIILKIMEYPTVLARWKVPLIAEAEIGDSWAAKLDWLSMLRGSEKHPMPDYIKGKTIERDPELLILGDKPEPSPRKEPVQLPAENPEPKEAPKAAAEPTRPEPEKPPAEEYVEEDEDLTLEEDDTPLPASKATPSVAPPPSTQEPHDFKHFAVFNLSTFTITDEIVVSLWQAMTFAMGEAIKQGKEGEMVPIEFRDCYGDVCYSARELYVSHPDELGRKFREWNLGSGKYELVEFHHV